MTSSRIHILLTFLLALALFALVSCGGGSGSGGGTPGPTPPPNATPLALDTIVTSNNLATTANNVDYWKFTATSGQLYKIELFATRFDQEGWNQGANLPHLILIDPAINTLLEHHFDNTATARISEPWVWGAHDLDIPIFYAKQDGTYYIGVSKEWATDLGGKYALRITDITTSINLVPADEAPGVDDPADVPGPATQIIQPGDTILGNYVYQEADYYAFTISNAPAIACFEVTANRNGVADDGDAYFDPTFSILDTVSNSNTLLVDGQGDADIDDYFFSDPKLCYRFDTVSPDPYFIKVEASNLGTTGGGDYFLNYTLVDTGFINVNQSKVDSGNAQSITSDDWVSTSINNTGTDWYEFLGSTGDMIRISYFDGTNSQTETNSATILICRNTVCDPLTATDFYATDDPINTGLGTGPGAFSVRTILNAGAVASNTVPYYFTVNGTALTDYTIKFEKFRAAISATGSDTSLNTLEIRDSLNGSIGINTSEELDERPLAGVGYGAGSMNATSSDVDTFQFIAQAGQFITINVYANQPANSNDMGDKVHDLSGHGSSFEPLLRVYKSPDFATEALAIAVARFDPAQYPSANGLGFDVAAESVTDFLPTISLSFIAPENNIYYMTLEAEQNVSGSTYFFEVIRQ